MIIFKTFKTAMQKQFASMIQDSTELFVTDITKEDLWNTYLESFPKGTNEIYKERREYDCVCCKQFIRRAGNIVAIKDNRLVSIWDIEVEYPYNIVAEKLSKLVKSASIRNIFRSNEANIGTDKNRQQLEDNTIKTWEHFYFKVPNTYINNSGYSIESLQGKARDSKNVFKRSMDELTLDAGQTILELINQGSIYRGEEYIPAIKEFIKAKINYEKVPEEEKDNWCWLQSSNSPIARIRNTAIGVLLIDISEDLDLNSAVNKFYSSVMCPENFKRPKRIHTKKMIEEAEKDIIKLGYEDSLGRRFANLEDITANNVIWQNKSIAKVNKSVFDELKDEIAISPKKFDKVEEVSIQDFIEKIVPTVKSIQVMVENRHSNNFMSLIGPKNIEAPCMLKWDNNFSQAYNGDLADSTMKQNVKNAGGKVDGILRFSIQWNEKGQNENDFDAHCIEPNSNLISYHKAGQIQPSSGRLDVDIIIPNGKVAVENITWTNINKMQEGRYQFMVHNYSDRGGKNGFRAEIEYGGEIYSYNFTKSIRNNQKVVVAVIEFSKDKGIKFIDSLDSTSTINSKEIWGISTNQFVPVTVFTYSPNFWDGQKGIGNKHYFFFLDKCINDSQPRGFFNEFLKEELMKHKRTFEALGSKMRVEPSDNQLSGLGFSSTQRNNVIVKVEGTFKRVLKIKF